VPGSGAHLQVRAQHAPRGTGGRASMDAAPAIRPRPSPTSFAASLHPSRPPDKPHPQTQLQQPHRHCSHPRTHHLCQSRHAYFDTDSCTYWVRTIFLRHEKAAAAPFARGVAPFRQKPGRCATGGRSRVKARRRGAAAGRANTAEAVAGLAAGGT
jgi:hypothetical protein